MFREICTVMLAMASTTLLPAACASTAQRVTWDDVPEQDVQRAVLQDPSSAATQFFSDDACVAEAEALLPANQKRARAMMKGCLHRDDFMLVTRFTEPAWRGFAFTSDDYVPLLRAELRQGSADDVNLERYGIAAPPLLRAPHKPDPSAMFLAYVEVDRAEIQKGVAGVLARPITYEATDKTKEYLQSYDLVEIKTGRVVAEDVKREIVKKQTGNRRLASVLDVPLFIALNEGIRLDVGRRYLLIVRDVASSAPPALTMRAIAVADARGD